MSSKRWVLIFTVVFLVVLILALLYAVLTHPKPQPIAVNFADRTSTVEIPPMFVGVGGVGATVSNTGAIQQITAINLLGNRIWAALDQLYWNGSTTPNYKLFDQQVERATQNGLDPIIVISGTPKSLGSSWCAVPTDVNAWAAMARDTVVHVNATRPGLKYEIWNEPDSSNTLCTSDPLHDYLNIYAAAAPAIKAAVPDVKVGGPTLAAPGRNLNWVQSLLDDARTAPYVDFVSWHLYVTGQWDIDQGLMNWQHLYDITQSPTQGLSYYYRQIESYVRKGSQPHAATTPIYLTEYNTNYVFGPTCCQNDYQFGPLWNTLALVDFMNAVNDGATRPPDKLNYYMSNASKSYFCILGQLNDKMDCAPPTDGVSYTPYPQFLAFELFTASSYLDIERTGASVVARPSTTTELVAAAFYTPHADDVVIVNPTATAFHNVPVTLDKIGLHTGFVCKEHVLVNGAMTTRILPLNVPAVDKAATVIDVPAYSTVAVQLAQGSE